MTTKSDNDNQRFLTVLAASAEKQNLRLGMDFVDNALWYGLDVGGHLHFLRTGRRVLEQTELPREYSVGEGKLHGMPDVARWRQAVFAG